MTANKPEPVAPRVTFGEKPISVAEVLGLATGRLRPVLTPAPRFRDEVERGARIVASAWQEGRPLYGVTTGFGDSCTRPVPPELTRELPQGLVRFHGCGLGKALSEQASAAVLAVRLASLARARSGVRFELLQALTDLLDRRVLPRIPEEGSVGASGDLTPLSYVAAVIQGDRDAFIDGVLRPAAEALKAAGLEPLRLEPKEGLAIMNGTSVMTALGCLAFARAREIARLAADVTGLCSVALRGNRRHFDPRIFEWKAHPGQAAAAARVRAMIGTPPDKDDEHGAVQDRYSIRCAPHVIGVLEDTLAWTERWLEVEINGVNDNPLIDPDRGDVLHGGNFYGGHIALAMDALKTAVASVADLLDRQIALLVDPTKSRGLPANLSGAPPERRSVNHGLKAVGIATSAWTAEALKLTMPATSFSRSTESHNQDKVSMGTIAARDALRILELTEQTTAATLLAAVQGVELRIRAGEL
ncbi:MAG: HAL/PAL/TAL family ammonia-lyase, partial [Planctomycetota bacterium]